jgi:pyruvate kinase
VCGLAVELGGAEARVGRLAEFADAQLKVGHECVISAEPGVAAGGGSAERFYVGHGSTGESMESARAAAAGNLLQLATTVAPGAEIHIQGPQLITLQVVECGGVVPGQDITEHEIRCTVIRPGRLTPHARVFLPLEGVLSELPILSSKDLEDLEWAVEMAADFVIVPCVRRAAHLEAARRVMRRATADATGETVQLIAKIESGEAVENFDELLQVASFSFGLLR